MQSNFGKVVIPRDILYKVYHEKGASAFNILSWLIINANFSDSSVPIKVGSKLKNVKRGEVFVSLKELAEVAQKSRRHVTRYVTDLVSMGVLSRVESMSKGVLLKVNNYDGLVRFSKNMSHHMSDDMSNECPAHVEDISYIRTKDITKEELKKNTLSSKIQRDPELQARKDLFLKSWKTLPDCYSQIKKVSEKRSKSLNAFSKEFSTEDIKQIFEELNNSSFLQGKNNNGWTADFDFVINKNNALKILEGKYMDKARKEELEELKRRESIKAMLGGSE